MPHSITDGADYTPPICRVWVAFWYQFCRVVLLSFLPLNLTAAFRSRWYARCGQGSSISLPQVVALHRRGEKVGVVYGNPEVTTGGRALKFYASIRIDVRKIEQLKGPGNEFIGSRTRAKIVKNKVAPPFKEAEFDIMYGKGISKVGEILDLAVKYDIIHKSGAWFSYNENRLGQGRDNVKNYISEHPDFMAELEAQVRERLMAENNAARAAAKPAEKPTPAAEPAPAAMPKKPTSRSGAKAKLDIVVDDDD